jgi:hypothetical protein
MKPMPNGGDETGPTPRHRRRIRVFHPEVARAHIGAMAETDLCFELPVSLLVQGRDQEPKGGIMILRRFGHDMGGFIPQRSAVPLMVLRDFDRPTEAAFPGIEAGKLVGVLRRSAHSSIQRTKDSDQIAQRTGLLLEHFTLSLDELSVLGRHGT